MSEDHSPVQAINPDKSSKSSSVHELAPENIQELEAELIQLAEADPKSPEINEREEDYPNKSEENPLLEAAENLGESPIEKNNDSADIISPRENTNPFEVDEPQIDSETPKDSPETNILKKYQSTLQDLKEEISRLNKQIDLKQKLTKPDPSEESLYKIRAVCKLTKAEAKQLRTTAENLAEANAQLSENIETLKDQSASKPISSQKLETLQNKLKALEKEYNDLNKSHELTIKDLEKALNPDTPQKFLNEFYVNLQRKIDSLDAENSSLTTILKKSSVELSKLKEKLENSTLRKKANDEIKNRLKGLEDTYENYLVTESRLKVGIKESLDEYSFYSDKPENQHDTESARNILRDMREQVSKLEAEEENLEFVLQEKKNLFRAAQVYGLQRSKTSNKLRSDMELLGMVLVEKEQAVSRLRKEIEELNIKTHKVQIDIRELQEKKNIFN